MFFDLVFIISMVILIFTVFMNEDDNDDRIAVHFVFDGPPGPTAGRFVEVELPAGASVGLGQWMEREDGYWALEIYVSKDQIRS